MRIKQLELVGFKSFVERTVLSFPSRVTGIVGPNGCGKSNVVDSIRWVLGEQSPKHLRGGAMEDVIFAGNEKHAPLGMAEVSIVFENLDPVRVDSVDPDLDLSTVPAHFRELPEIMVTRRYYRSGESEYFINKTACRLKDITELFLGTGVGSKAYAIIEQGRVDQLVNAKPEDRRLFIEEAAGTTLYRSRKLAAERKMERTRENLARVTDILHELDRQIQYLNRQAKKAEQYRALQEEIRALDLSVAGLQWRRLVWEAAALAERRTDATEQETLLQSEIAALEAAREDAGVAVTRSDNRLAQCREALAVLEAERESQRQRIELMSQELRERERRLARLAADEAAMASRGASLAHEFDVAVSERDVCAGELQSDDAALAEHEAALAAARGGHRTALAAVEAAKSGLVTLVTQIAESRNQIAALTRRREDAERRLARLAEEREGVMQQLQSASHELEERRRVVAELQQRLEVAAGDKERRASRVRGLAEERRASERRLGELRHELVQVQSRRQSLEEIQRNYEGYQPGVRAIMASEQPTESVLGVVADVIGIPEEYERAVAAALGDRLQYVIVSEAAEGVGAVAMLREQSSGRGSFIPLAPRPVPLRGLGAAGVNGNSARLIDLVQVDERYRQVAETLLGEVVLVPTLGEALHLWQQNGRYVTLVTPEGDVMNANGVITGGSEAPVEAEILARRRELHERSARAAVLEQQIVEMDVQLTAVAARIHEEETTLAALDRDTHAATLDLVAAEKDIERLDRDIPRLSDRLEVVRFETEALTADGIEIESQLAGSAQRLAEHEERQTELVRDLEDRQRDAEAAAAASDHAGAALTSVKVRVAERRERQSALTAAVARLAASRAEITQREESLRAERAATAEERASLETSLADAEKSAAVQAQRRRVLEGDVTEAQLVAEAAAAKLAEHDRGLATVRQQIDDVRRLLAQNEVAVAEHRVQIEHLDGGMREKYDVDLAHEATEQDSGPVDGAAERLQLLRERIARIGEVNVSAIDELKELEDRAQFLRTQRTDLEQSLDDLDRTIQRLNRASRARFAETFAKVNERFQVVFPRLFRGGEARLVLTDEHNLLDSGVEIIVRPPGKRLDTVSLLSGGEKALVAVSLIFSLFLINPTPFCFLDEVDAPLDDANIGRFIQMVREMSSTSQFIVITHNKRTMDVAETLYGVTMQEPGISKVISVAMR